MKNLRYMKTWELLEKAKSKIDTPEKWIKGEFARTAKGNVTSSNSKSACKFCSIGTIESFAIPLDTYITLRQYLYKALQTIGTNHCPVSNFNDNPLTKHKDVMNMFDTAIELAKKDNP